jgi:hypothetical protein
MFYPNHIRIIAFADNKVYKYGRIVDEAEQSRYFKSCQGFMLKDLDFSFREKHQTFIQSHPRLYGYAIWKPYIILTELSKLNENDILVYVDSGANIISSVEGNRMIDRLYQELLSDKEICMIIRDIPFYERAWSKMDCLLQISKYYNIPSNDLRQLCFNTFENQRESGMLLFKKTDMSLKMVNDWYTLMTAYSNIDDSPSSTANDPSFVEHRHDQSVLSMISKIHNRHCIVKRDLFPFRRKGACLSLHCDVADIQ